MAIFFDAAVRIALFASTVNHIVWAADDVQEDTGLPVKLMTGVPLENGTLVDVQKVKIPNRDSTAKDFVTECMKVGGQPVCSGGYSCTEDDKCAALSMEEPYCNAPMRGIARHLGFTGATNPFFSDICAYYPQFAEGGACLGPDAYRHVDQLGNLTITAYTLCATPLQTGTQNSFLTNNGPCAVHNDCVMSPRYPLMYPGSSCAISVLHDGTVSTPSFSTVSDKDVLSINGKDYSGESDGPLNVQVRSGDLIVWKSLANQRGLNTNAGWRLCLTRSIDVSPERVRNLTHQLDVEKQRRKQEEKEAEKREASLDKELKQTQSNLRRYIQVVRAQAQQESALNEELDQAKKSESRLQKSLNASEEEKARVRFKAAELGERLNAMEHNVTELTSVNHNLQEQLDLEKSKAKWYKQNWSFAAADLSDERAHSKLLEQQIHNLRTNFSNDTNATDAKMQELKAEAQQAADNASRYRLEAEGYRRNLSTLQGELDKQVRDTRAAKAQAASIERDLRDRLNTSQHALDEAKVREKHLVNRLGVRENETKVLLQQDRTQKSKLHHQQALLQNMSRDLKRYANASSLIERKDKQLLQAERNESRLQLKVQSLQNNVTSLDGKLRKSVNAINKSNKEVAQLQQDMKDKIAETAGAMAAKEQSIEELEQREYKAETKALMLEKQNNSWKWGVGLSGSVIIIFGFMFCAQKRSDKLRRQQSGLDEPLLKVEAGQCEAPHTSLGRKAVAFEPEFAIADWKDEQGMLRKSIQVSAPGRDFRTGNRTIRGTLEENCNGVNGVKLTLTKEPDVPSGVTVTEGAVAPSGEWTKTFDFQDGRHWKVHNEDFDAHGVWQVDLAHHDTGRKWYVAQHCDMASDGEDENPSPMGGTTRRRLRSASWITQASTKGSDDGRSVGSPNLHPQSRTSTISASGFDLEEDAGQGDSEGVGEVDPYAVEWSDLKAASDDDRERSAAEEDSAGEASGKPSDRSAGSQMSSSPPTKRQAANLHAPMYAAAMR